MSLDTETMALNVLKDFAVYRGSLTWVVREGDSWWCNFARYGKENAQTVLVKLDEEWRELGAWAYPPEVIKELGQMSISGGIWKENRLLVTGHDKRIIYRLHLPQMGNVLELVEKLPKLPKLPSPFPGQGIALDTKTGGLVGINRAKREVGLPNCTIDYSDWEEAVTTSLLRAAFEMCSEKHGGSAICRTVRWGVFGSAQATTIGFLEFRCH